jgi:hypothetical protein
MVYFTINSIPLKCPSETFDKIKSTIEDLTLFDVFGMCDKKIILYLDTHEVDCFSTDIHFQLKDKDGNQSPYEFN